MRRTKENADKTRRELLEAASRVFALTSRHHIYVNCKKYASKLDKADRLNLRIDAGFGEDGNQAFYLGFAETF